MLSARACHGYIALCQGAQGWQTHDLTASCESKREQASLPKGAGGDLNDTLSSMFRRVRRDMIETISDGVIPTLRKCKISAV